MIDTLFTGHRITFLHSVDSTNNYAAKLLNEGHGLEGSVIVAEEQTQGRGRHDKKWHSAPGENLLVSLIYLPHFLRAADAFGLNAMASVGLVTFLKTLGILAKIKWPNDVMVGDQKIAGILIETQVRGSFLSSAVIGIGLNVNQIEGLEPGATSVCAQNGHLQVIRDLLPAFCNHIEGAYLRLKANQAVLHREYEKALYALHVSKKYQFSDGSDEAILEGITLNGYARMTRQGETRLYNLDEVTLLRNL